MVEEVADENGRPEVGELGDVFADRVVERELAVLAEKGDGGCRELLGHRPRFEDRVRAEPDPILEVGHAVGLDQDGLALDGDPDDAAGRVAPVPALEDAVDLGLGRKPRRFRGGRLLLGLGRDQGHHRQSEG